MAAKPSRRSAPPTKSARNTRKPVPPRAREPKAAAPTPPPRASQPERRSTYVQAVAIYEQAIRMLQQRHYGKAADLLHHMIAGYPEERELLERSRTYLSLCERQLKPLTAEPQDATERLYAATLALNAGDIDRAVGHLEQILQQEPSNDQALYMLAVAQAERGELEDAIRYLERAIQANPENRGLARLDPDLDDLREEDAVIELLEPRSSPPHVDNRRALRRR